uniref:N-acetyltransferase family 8 member 3-like n=1 Tax=Jaculus jaculus TaxID=51337 RepID=UPI000332FD93|nr:N-acetyltransferase family 8 member 3-like [Jaculus jaculus]
MAPHHIRIYEESHRERVVDLFTRGMEEHISVTFHHMLMLPQTLVLLIGVPLTVFMVLGSWLLVLISSFTLFVLLWFLAKYTWDKYVFLCLHKDMADITKTYLSARDSCFWVAESGGQVVGIVAAMPREVSLLQRKQLHLRHLSVSLEHRRTGIGKALVRTVLQFARDQGYSEVVLGVSILQHAALALYQSMGFQNTGKTFFSRISRLRNTPIIHFMYRLTSPEAGL